MMDTQAVRKRGIARELGETMVLLGLAGSSVAGFLAIVDVATRALGR
jgi:hypothetical protein